MCPSAKLQSLFNLDPLHVDGVQLEDEVGGTAEGDSAHDDERVLELDDGGETQGQGQVGAARLSALEQDKNLMF